MFCGHRLGSVFVVAVRGRMTGSTAQTKWAAAFLLMTLTSTFFPSELGASSQSHTALTSASSPVFFCFPESTIRMALNGDHAGNLGSSRSCSIKLSPSRGDSLGMHSRSSSGEVGPLHLGRTGDDFCQAWSSENQNLNATDSTISI